MLWEAEADFELEHFMQVMDIWTLDPQYVSPAILRSEIISSIISSNERLIERRLLCKSSAHPPTLQTVHYHPVNDQGIF